MEERLIDLEETENLLSNCKKSRGNQWQKKKGRTLRHGEPLP